MCETKLSNCAIKYIRNIRGVQHIFLLGRSTVTDIIPYTNTPHSTVYSHPYTVWHTSVQGIANANEKGLVKPIYVLANRKHNHKYNLQLVWKIVQKIAP